MDDRLKMLWQTARKDQKFQRMKREFIHLENALSNMVKDLSNEQQDIIWEFVMSSTELDFYLIDVALDMLEKSKTKE